MILFLNDIAGSEILLILVFILIFFGSKSIPGIARTMGRTLRQIKDATQEVQNEITKSGLDIRKDMNIRRSVEETMGDIRRPLDQHASDINQVLNDSTPFQSRRNIIHDPVDPNPNKSDADDSISPDQPKS